jgi:hypothetical protein
MAKIPARYVGGCDITLSKFGGPYFDGDGQRLTNLTLHPGDTLMMDEEEVLGVSWLHDPRHENESQKVGVGKQVLEQHNGLQDHELRDLGYQFHTGRSDFEPIVVPAEKRSKTAPLGDSK